MSKNYTATVSSVSDEGTRVITSGTGPFEVANFAAKAGFKKIAEQPGEFRVTFAEVDEDGEVVRQIASVTADADVASYVGKKKIAGERKALNPASDEDETASE